LWRMNQVPICWCVGTAYPGTLCSKFAAPRQHEKFPLNQRFEDEIGSAMGTGISWPAH